MTAPTRPKVAMLLYPGRTPLDLIAPHAAFAGTMETHLVWKSTDPVQSDSGVVLQPTTTFADCPADLDVLFVPGGLGQASVAADEDVLEFLADRGARARYVTSVCGGSLILGAAGLLRGYRATTHWSGIEALALFGAEYAEGRVVLDRNRITRRRSHGRPRLRPCRARAAAGGGGRQGDIVDAGVRPGPALRRRHTGDRRA